MIIHGRVHDPTSAGGERNAKAATVVRNEGSRDEPRLLESIETTGHSCAGHHQCSGER
jgi:hypothetical protein